VTAGREAACSPAALARLAQTAERLGCHSIWAIDHVVIPDRIESRHPAGGGIPPYFRTETPWADSLSVLAFLAGITTRIRLGTAVIPIITRHPLALAKQAATVDLLSGERLELGLGAGWLDEEAEALGQGHDRKQARLRQAIEIMREAWTEPTVGRVDGLWRFAPVGVHPQPAGAAGIPIWIGARGPLGVATAAELGVGVVLMHSTPGTVAQVGGRLRALNPSGKVAAMVPLDRASDARDTAGRLREAGLDLLILSCGADLGRFVGELEELRGLTDF